MVLSDVDIRRYLTEGKIKISPALPPDQYGSCSVDFRLGEEFSIFEHSRHALIDLRQKIAIQDLMRSITVAQGDPFILQPALRWRSPRRLELDDDVLGRLEGRSSLASASLCMERRAARSRLARPARRSSAIWADAGGAVSGMRIRSSRLG
jgi:dCTP deaminase